MIKHLEQYNIDVSLNEKIIHKVHCVTDVLDRPIAEHRLNILGTNHPCESVQTYGWKSPIRSHTDDTGCIFFMPIYMESGTDTLVCGDTQIPLELGHLYLLDDNVMHSTIGAGNVVSLFYGAVDAEYLNEQLYKEVFEKFKSYLKD